MEKLNVMFTLNYPLRWPRRGNVQSYLNPCMEHRTLRTSGRTAIRRFCRTVDSLLAKDPRQSFTILFLTCNDLCMGMIFLRLEIRKRTRSLKLYSSKSTTYASKVASGQKPRMARK
eukprot:8215575-Karenia_brevis.AAC.1